MAISYFFEESLSVHRADERPLPFRRLSRRSGRIPAEPYPPLKCPHCSRKAKQPFWPQSDKFRGLGQSPNSEKAIIPYLPPDLPGLRRQTYPQILL